MALILILSPLALPGCEPPPQFLKVTHTDQNLQAIYNVSGTNLAPVGDNSFHIGQRPVQIPRVWLDRAQDEQNTGSINSRSPAKARDTRR